jgi:hypothetical protein
MMDLYQGPRRAERQEYTDMMNGYPKHVVSKTLQEPPKWNNSTPIKNDVAEEVANLRQQPGKDILDFWQRRSPQRADETWPHRRVPAHGLSHCLGKRETSLRGWTRHHRSGTRGYEGVRLERRPSRTVAEPQRREARESSPGHGEDGKNEPRTGRLCRTVLSSLPRSRGWMGRDDRGRDEETPCSVVERPKVADTPESYPREED